jgi:hypothetical protein
MSGPIPNIPSLHAGAATKSQKCIPPPPDFVICIVSEIVIEPEVRDPDRSVLVHHFGTERSAGRDEGCY